MSKLSYKTLFIIFFFLLIGVIVLSKFALPNQKVSAAWWNDMWNYRKAISIANTSGSNQSNMVVKINIDTSTLISTNKMQSTCDDIRITDLNNNILQYYVTQCNTSSTNIYTKIPNTPSSGSGIYIYYGNSTANNIEANSIFTYFDDFESGITQDTWSTSNVSIGITSGFANKGNYSQKFIAQGSSYDTLTQTFSTTHDWTDQYLEYEFYTDVASSWWMTDPRNSSGTRMNSWNTFTMAASSWVTFSKDLNTNTYVTDIKSVFYATQSDDINRNIFIDNFRIRHCLSTVTTGSPQSEETGTAPIAYWKFDEGIGTTAYDSTSNRNNGIVSGDWQTEDQCVSGKCLTSDGTHGYANIGTSLNSYFTNQNFTIESWINPARLNGADVTNYEIFGNESYQNYGILLRLDINGTPGAISFRTSQSGAVQATYSNRITIANTWYHVAAVRNGSSVRIYINGKDQTSSAGNHINPTLSSISTRIGGGGQYFNGKLDEPKIYPYARTAAQIKLDYNAGKAHASSTEGTSTSLGSNKNNGDLSDGLIGYWKMDEGVGTSITDSSGNSNTGTFSGSTLPTWSTGKYGIGISFNGINTYTTLPTIIGGSTSFSVAGWIKLNADQTSRTIFSNQTTSSNSWVVGISDSTTNILKFYLGSAHLYAVTPLVSGVWTHFIVTYDNGNPKIYLNGQLDNSSTNTIVASGTYLNNAIGCLYRSGGCAGQYFNGSIDELRTYNRALSPSEVSDLYNYAPGPITYYDFNEATGTIANDKSGNNHSGTLQNSPSWIQGKIGGALDFNAAGRKVLITNPIGQLGYTTISLWYKVSSTASGSWRTLLGHQSANIHHLIINNSSRNIGIFDGSWRDFGYLPPTDNQFHHYEVIYNNGVNATLYVDGVYKNQIATTLDLSANPIGSIGDWNGNGYWAGPIDDVKIYNYARTQKQIIEDMNAGAPATSTKSMLAYYKFDEGQGTTVYNSGIGGTVLNGTFIGTTYPTWSNNGKTNKALLFDGLTNTLSVSHNSNLNIGTGSYSVFSWVKLSASTGAHDIIVDKGGANVNDGGFWWGMTTDGKQDANINIGTSFLFSNQTSNSRIDDNKWHRVGFTWDPTIGLKFWLDGKIDGSVGIATTANIQGTSSLYVGGYSNFSGFSSNGLIDEVKIYNYALTSEEIKQDYNQGSATSFGSTTQTIGATTTSLDYCIPGDTSYCASPIAEYKMDEGVGTSAFDTSGNNLSAGFSGTDPTWVQGKIGKGLKFDGVDDRLTLNSSVNLNSNANWTVSAWVKTTNTGVNPILSNKDGGPVYNDFLVSSSKIYYDHYNGSWISETGKTNVADGKWHFLTWVNHSNSTMDMYVDGVGDTLGVSSALSSNGPVNQIGRDWYRTTNGSIDQFRIYNYARTPAQIAYDYNKGGPVGWWKFDECQGNIAYDWSGIGNTGVINIGASGSQNSLGTCQVGTSAAWTNGATGKLNSSLNFDGVDDYISTSQSSYDPNFTWSVWLKPTNVSTDQMFLGPSSGVSSAYYFRINGSKPYISITTGTQQTLTGNITLQNNNWYHLVGIYDGLYLYIYVNGILDKKSSLINTVLSTPWGIGKIGRWTDGDNRSFFGQIDDVRIYNYALTSEQVKVLYNGGGVIFN